MVHIGTILDGRYRIDAILGSGGMGRVYRGEHTGIGRQVAIKVLHADLGRNREAAARFQREALASGRLDHTNIVGVSDFGVIDDGPCYLVMEALEGESLGDRLQRDRRIAWREAIEIIRGVLAGLRHAHDRGVVHRDIKPDNIFLAVKEGELVVKILDFGIAKLAAGTVDDPAATRAGLTVGTPAYLSPEQAVGGEITPACDLYSTTIVLFEMIAGRAPFEDKDPLSMLGAHVGRPPPRIADVAPELEIPPELEDILQLGLAKMTSERIRTAVDYLGLLEPIAPYDPAHRVRGSQSHISTPRAAAYVTPIPGGLGTAPTASLATTPVPNRQTPSPGDGEPVSAVGLTSMLDSLTDDPSLPLRTISPRAHSIAEAPEQIPKRWIAIGGVVIVGFLIVAFVLVVSLRAHPSTLDPAAKPVPTKPAPAKPSKASVAPPAEPAPAPHAMTVPDSRDAELKAALHELQNGKTCPERKAAIARLVALGDARALAPIKTARYRMRGGFLGFNQDNTNACLRADADAALKKLTPPKSKP
ncbi:MAG: serine/threonine protein kinase [Deltaproteobacteria bacterium]|nr:serine/threonine protein kinase [Deltaproteobacteria bacterium]